MRDVKAELTTGDDVEDMVVLGGIDPPMSWDEYLASGWQHPPEDAVAIRACLEREGMVGTLAAEACNDTAFIVVGGAYAARRYGFTWRAWGDLMSAIVGKREGYMAYYA